jgi:hypothetical protein
MDYNKIIGQGLGCHLEHILKYGFVSDEFFVRYFKREAQKAKEQYYEYDEFFEGLENEILIQRFKTGNGICKCTRGYVA